MTSASTRERQGLAIALLGVVGRALAPTRLVDFSTEQVRFLTYGRAIDTSRAQRELGFVAKRSTAASSARSARATASASMCACW